MRRWIKDILGRWAAQRIRTKKFRDDYRMYEKNGVILENGGWL